MSIFSQRFNSLKAYNDVLCYDIAKAIHTSSSAVSDYLNDKREPDIETIKALAEYFNVSTDYLLGVGEEITEQIRRNKK